MPLSYNVIKKSCVNSNSIYTVKAPVIPLKVEKMEAEVVEDTSFEEAKAYAEALINDAMGKSRQITDSAKKEAEVIKKDAYNIAYNMGHDQGKKDGYEEGLKSTENARREALDVLEEAHRASRQYIGDKRDEIVGLALHIAEKIIGYQVDVNESVIYKIVNDSINEAVVKGQIIIRVNPMDYAVMDCRINELSKVAGDNVIINLIRDGDIKRGGCRIETGSSSVDATIDSQFEKIKEALLG